MERVSRNQLWGGFPVSYDKQLSQLAAADSRLSREMAVAGVGSVSTEGRRCLPSICSSVTCAASPGSNPFFLASPSHVLCLVSMDTEIHLKNNMRGTEWRKISDQLCFPSFLGPCVKIR